MACVKVWFRDGSSDTYDTEGGETDALAMELEADPDVLRVETHYDSD
jgi:hypothetical protein